MTQKRKNKEKIKTKTM